VAAPPQARGERRRRLRGWAVAPVLVLALLLGCGYRTVTAYHAQGGADRIHVRAFQNDSGDPELGSAVTAALRDELARRGAGADPGAPAQLDGAVRVTSPTPSSYYSASAPVTLEVHARLTVNGTLVHELTIRRTEVQQGGADALEAEGRRATTLRGLARDAAREVLAAFEEQPR
jgi:hypothetical protein